MTGAPVPRGTRVRALDFRPESVAALLIRTKTETRRLLTASNSAIQRVGFDSLQLDLARSDGLVPAGGLRCRAKIAAGYRTVQVASVTRPGDYIWARTKQAPRIADRNWCLEVREVAASRLQDITEEQAIREGVEAFTGAIDPEWPPWASRAWTLNAPRWVPPYMTLLGGLGIRQRALWIKTEDHREARAQGPTARQCFALLWCQLHGLNSWRENPWVWCYRVDYVDASPLFMRAHDPALENLNGPA